jgi:hypothetical protein
VLCKTLNEQPSPVENLIVSCASWSCPTYTCYIYCLLCLHQSTRPCFQAWPLPTQSLNLLPRTRRLDATALAPVIVDHEHHRNKPEDNNVCCKASAPLHDALRPQGSRGVRRGGEKPCKSERSQSRRHSQITKWADAPTSFASDSIKSQTTVKAPWKTENMMLKIDWMTARTDWTRPLCGVSCRRGSARGIASVRRWSLTSTVWKTPERRLAMMTELL